MEKISKIDGLPLGSLDGDQEKNGLFDGFVRLARRQIKNSPIIRLIRGKKFEKDLSPEEIVVIRDACEAVVAEYSERLENFDISSFTLAEAWQAIKEPFLEAQNKGVDVIDLKKQIPDLLKKIAEKWHEKLLSDFREFENQTESVIITASALLDVRKNLNLIKELDIKMEIGINFTLEAIPRLAREIAKICESNLAQLEIDRNSQAHKDALEADLKKLALLGVDVADMQKKLKTIKIIDLNQTTGFVFRGILKED